MHAPRAVAIRDIAAVAMRTLAHLHAAMGKISTSAAMPADVADVADTVDLDIRRRVVLPGAVAHPVIWLAQRHARVSSRPAPVLPEGLTRHYAEVMSRAAAHLAEAAASIPGPTGWLHGDYHAGNLLFSEADGTGTRITGILDFDDVGLGSPWLEAAFALFALTRDTAVEHAFAYDANIWDLGLDAYATQRRASSHPGINMDTGTRAGADTKNKTESDTEAGTSPESMPLYLGMNRDALMTLFCIDQILIHLEAAQRGLWQPGPGIGFLGCWHQLLKEPRSLNEAPSLNAPSPLNEAPSSSIRNASTVAGRASP